METEQCYCDRLDDGRCAYCLEADGVDIGDGADGDECGCAYCVEGERSGLEGCCSEN